MTLPLFDVPEEWRKRRRCWVCGCALSTTYAFTYVVRRQSWVKIGATNDPRRRLNELARPAWSKHLLSPDGMNWEEPLTTIAVIPRDIEHAAHALFSDYHEVGEWFRATTWIEEWAAGQLDPET